MNKNRKNLKRSWYNPNKHNKRNVSRGYNHGGSVSRGGGRLDCNNDEGLPITEVWLFGTPYDVATTTTISIQNEDFRNQELPPEIGCLTNLTYLSISALITGDIPPEIGNLTNLTYLNLTYNKLGCKVMPESGWDCIEHCNGTNGCTGELPPELGNLTNLEYLGFHENYLVGTIPEEYCNLPVVTQVDWEGNPDGNFTFNANNLCPPLPSCMSPGECGDMPIPSCVSSDEYYCGNSPNVYWWGPDLECQRNDCGFYSNSDCPSPGDMNGDGVHNILDIVSLANCILNNNC